MKWSILRPGPSLTRQSRRRPEVAHFYSTARAGSHADSSIQSPDEDEDTAAVNRNLKEHEGEDRIT